MKDTICNGKSGYFLVNFSWVLAAGDTFPLELSYFFIIVLLFCVIGFVLHLFVKKIVGYYTCTEENLIMTGDTIPWSRIDHIILKTTEMENPCLCFYFRDGAPPRGVDIGFLASKEELINSL